MSVDAHLLCYRLLSTNECRQNEQAAQTENSVLKTSTELVVRSHEATRAKVNHTFLKKVERSLKATRALNLHWKCIQSSVKPSKTPTANEEQTHVKIFPHLVNASMNDLNMHQYVSLLMQVLSYLELFLFCDVQVTVLMQCKSCLPHASCVRRSYQSFSVVN